MFRRPQAGFKRSNIKHRIAWISRLWCRHILRSKYTHDSSYTFHVVNQDRALIKGRETRWKNIIYVRPNNWIHMTDGHSWAKKTKIRRFEEIWMMMMTKKKWHTLLLVSLSGITDSSNCYFLNARQKPLGIIINYYIHNIVIIINHSRSHRLYLLCKLSRLLYLIYPFVFLDKW